MQKLIVIPTYNEKDNILNLLEQIFKIVPDVHILIVDDASPDGTGQFIDNIIEKNTFSNRLHIMHRSGKLGLGSAYIQGFTWGMEQGFEILTSMDADFSHKPEYLPQIFETMKTHDLVIASRYVKGGGVEDWGLFRRILSFGGSLYARIALLSNIHDFTGGFNCYHAQFLKKIKLSQVQSKGYCFQIEMKFRHVLLNAKIKEIPIIFPDRKLGTSKMSGNIIQEAVINVLKLSLLRNKIKKQMAN
ncbi:MAG: polyprenol monophosphomannose synthase [Alphaproteobacteria bacterium]|nr:polyprenol monophosphomannose synthase [Alphaproteobacteria bacterium]